MKKMGLRALCLGFTAALIGFSIALATAENASDDGLVSDRSSARLVGSITISNPLLAGTNLFDLGDGGLGSQIVRYLCAYNGSRPYIWKTTTVGSTGLALGNNGFLFGPLAAASPSPFTFFDATVNDTDAAARTGRFRIGTTNTTTQFRFAMDKLPSALIGEDYVTNVELIGGTLLTTNPGTGDTVTPTAKVGLVAGTLKLDGATFTRPELLGFSIFPDGTIAGRPLRTGTITFTLRGQKVTGSAIANNRSNTAQDQSFSITVLKESQATNGAVQTEFACSATNLRANLSKPGRDGLGFNLFYDPDGLSATDYSGKIFTLRFGNRTYATKLDAIGQSKSGVLLVKNSAPTGTLKLKVRSQDFSTLFDSSVLVDKSKLIVPFEIQIGDEYLSTEPVEYGVQNRKGNVSLKYILGKNRQPGGLFQITKVQARDSGGSTAFKITFLINNMPDSTSEQFGAISTFTVNIGPSFTQTVTLIKDKGRFAPTTNGGLQAVTISTKRRVGTITTYPIPQSASGIAPASTGGGAVQTLRMQVIAKTSTLTFSGKASRRLFPFVSR